MAITIQIEGQNRAKPALQDAADDIRHVGKAADDTNTKSRGLFGGIASLGGKAAGVLATGVVAGAGLAAAAIGGIGAVGVRAFSDVDAGVDNLAVATGATGAALDDMAAGCSTSKAPPPDLGGAWVIWAWSWVKCGPVPA